MHRFFWAFPLFFLVVSLGSSGCGTVNVEDLNPANYNVDNVSSVTFRNNIINVFESESLDLKCTTSGCHVVGSDQTDLVLKLSQAEGIDSRAIYDALFEESTQGLPVNLADAENSLILFNPLGNGGCAAAYTNGKSDINYLTIRNWIQNGAPY